MSADADLSSEIQRVLHEYGQSLDPLSLDDAVQKFLKNEQAELSPNTLAEYERELTRFTSFCDRNGVEDTSEFSGRVLHDFKIWRRDEAHDKDGSLSNKTMRDEMYLLRKFLRFLESIDAVTPDLHKKIEIPSLDPGDGKRDIDFPAKRIEAILDHLKKYEYATREHAVWILFAATGRRPSDLRALDCGDIHLDEENPYIEFRHRDGETRLKNGKSSENSVNISDTAARVLSDYIDVHRVDVDEDDREPLLTSSYGRLSTTTIQKYVHKWSRPCMVGEDCPEGRDERTCEAMESIDHATKCPHSKPPVALRHGYISDLRRKGVPLHIISDRCDASEEVIEEYYSELSEAEKRELRRQELEKVSDDRGYL